MDENGEIEGGNTYDTTIILKDLPSFQAATVTVSAPTQSSIPCGFGEYRAAQELFIEIIAFVRTQLTDQGQMPRVMNRQTIVRAQDGTLAIADNNSIVPLTFEGRPAVTRWLGDLLSYIICGVEEINLKHCSTSLKNLIALMKSSTSNFTLSDVAQHPWVTTSLLEIGKCEMFIFLIFFCHLIPCSILDPAEVIKKRPSLQPNLTVTPFTTIVGAPAKTEKGTSRDPPLQNAPISFEAWLAGCWYQEDTIIWNVFKEMLKIAETNGDRGGQCNHINFEFNPKKKIVTMKALVDCETDAKYQYTSTGDVGFEARQVFALVMTLQKILTAEIPGPLSACDKIKHKISDDAWQLLNNALINKQWTTYAQIKNSAWYIKSPNTRAREKKNQIKEKGVAKLCSDFQAHSKFHNDSLLK